MLYQSICFPSYIAQHLENDECLLMYGIGVVYQERDGNCAAVDRRI